MTVTPVLFDQLATLPRGQLDLLVRATQSGPGIPAGLSWWVAHLVDWECNRRIGCEKKLVGALTRLNGAELGGAARVTRELVTRLWGSPLQPVLTSIADAIERLETGAKTNPYVGA